MKMELSTEHTPYLISWNVTRRCNLNCAHCYLDAGHRAVPSSRELTTPEGFRLLDEIAEFCSGALLILSGGEPLLRRDILDLARYATNKKLMVVLGTNGYIVTEEVVRRFLDIGIAGLGISLDSLKPTVHDTFRGRTSSWRRAVMAMETCRKWGLDFQVQTSVTSDNILEIASLMKFASELGARVFNLFFLVCTGRGEQVTDITPIQYEQVLSQIVQSDGHYNGMLVRARCAPYISRIALQNQKEVSPRENYLGCIAATHYCRITPDGEVTPCPYLPVQAGNLREKGFAEIWRQSEVLIALRAAQVRGKCGICRYQSICRGCRARAFATTGDYLAEDPWCRYVPKTERPAATDVAPEHPQKPVWSKEATRRFEGAPAFVREMVMKKIERYATERGYERITPEVIAEVKKNWNLTHNP